MNGEEISCWTKRDDLAKGGGGRRGGKVGGERGRFVPDFKNGCAVCGDRNHWKDECPDKGTDRDRFASGRGDRGRGGQGRQAGQGRGRGGQVLDGEVHSNQLRTADCNRCKFASKNLSSCVGCKKTNNIDHCLLHCVQYSALGVEDRVRLVKNANGCAVCLNTSHLADSCNYKEKNNWVCGLEGCRSHHHPTLHGSKDIFVKINTVVGEQSRFEEVTDWDARADYLHDSFLASDQVASNISKEREAELKEVLVELHKPGLRGDQVLLVVQDVDMVFGMGRQVTKIVTFFDDGSTCSVILNSVAVEFGLLG